MNQYTIKDFGKIIKHNAQSQRHELLPNGTNAFRIYDRNQEDFPITVDIYANYARVQVYSDDEFSPETVEIITDQINRMAYIDRDKIVFSYRAKREKGQQHEKTENDAVIVTVKENNLLFKVDLSTYTDTGLFLDHINTRAMIAEMSAGMNVLNLFSYTGAFSVYAASGRAAKVTSVDMSATYSRWAEENLSANGFEGDTYKSVCCDATKFVKEAMEKGEKYDIIIFDPPSFSNSHKMEEDFDVQRDFLTWIKNLRSILTKSGIIMFSTNLGNFKIDKRRLRGFIVKEMTNQLWADGFVKGRKGTTRSWLMAMDENSLTLDWSEDKDSKKAESPKREYRGERSNRSYGERRDSRDHREHGERRGYGERRERSDRSSERSNRGEYRERRSYNRDGGERREFRDRDERRSYGDRRERDYRSERGERRDFHGDRDRRSFDRPRYDHSDYEAKHRYSERREDRPQFDRPRSDRPRFDRSERSDRPRFDRSERSDRSERPRRDDREKKDKKPYGYDTFKPARSRDDSADFFWNED